MLKSREMRVEQPTSIHAHLLERFALLLTDFYHPRSPTHCPSPAAVLALTMSVLLVHI